MSSDCPQATMRRLDPVQYGRLLGVDLQDRSCTAVHSIVRSQCPTLPGATAGANPVVCADLTRLYDRIGQQHHTRMVRVVDLPVAPPMRTELDRLALHAFCGGHWRVLTEAFVARWEHTAHTVDILGPIGDVIVVGPHVYRQIRDDHGEVVQVERTSDAALADSWRLVISLLYDRGEDPGGFCRRELSPVCLMPPASVVAVPSPRTGQGGGVAPVDRLHHHAGVVAVTGRTA
jgi:hypothetical protein